MWSRSVMILSLFLCVTGIARAQQTVAVFEFQGIGLSQAEADAASQIFRGELDATGSFRVMSKADVETKLAARGIQSPVCHAVGCATEYGEAAGVAEATIGTLTMLGNRITGEVQIVDVATKQVTFSDRFTAANLDDLEATLRKLAGAVANRRKIESEVGRFPVTEEETGEAARKHSYVTAGMGFGTGVPLGDSYGNINSLSQFLFISRYEADKFVVETSIGFQWGSGGDRDTITDEFGDDVIVNPMDVAVLPIDIGLRYVFDRKAEFTPFVGGGIGLHFVTVTTKAPGDVDYDRSGTAFAYSAAAGFYAFQSYDFRLSLEGRYSMMFSDAFSDDKNFHHQVGFVVALTHKLERKEGRRSGCGPRLFP
jgi:hypothetical protein